VKKLSNYDLLRVIALIVLFAGAVSSLTLMFNAGRNQNSILLIVLFTGWVLSPFIGLFIAHMISKRWLGKTRLTIYLLIIFIAIASFKFLVVPLISWVLILIIVPIKRKKYHESNGKN
jgi:MFS family permease